MLKLYRSEKRLIKSFPFKVRDLDVKQTDKIIENILLLPCKYLDKLSKFSRQNFDLSGPKTTQ